MIYAENSPKHERADVFKQILKLFIYNWQDSSLVERRLATQVAGVRSLAETCDLLV